MKEIDIDEMLGGENLYSLKNSCANYHSSSFRTTQETSKSVLICLNEFHSENEERGCDLCQNFVAKKNKSKKKRKKI